jgi:hypothetical protein
MNMSELIIEFLYSIWLFLEHWEPATDREKRFKKDLFDTYIMYNHRVS